MKEVFMCKEEISENCVNCPFHISGNRCVPMRKWVDDTGRHPKCPIRSIEKHDKEVKKRVAKEIYDKLINDFTKQSAYGLDCNQHSGYYDYKMKVSDIVLQLREYAEQYGLEYGVEVDE